VSSKSVSSHKSGLLADVLGIDPRRSGTIPFFVGGVTAGSETELQAAVAGRATTGDLPLSIRGLKLFSECGPPRRRRGYVTLINHTA